MDFPRILSRMKDLDENHVQALLSRAHSIKQRLVEEGLYPHYSNYKLHQLMPKKIKHRALTLSSLFFENSTRTKLSFEVAARNLGFRILDFDIKSSSIEKGEDLEFTLRTLTNLGVNVVVVRSSISQFLEELRQKMQLFSHLAIINAGDGLSEHVTQALGDLFTFQQLNILPPGSKLLIHGDLLHSRVARSLIQLLPKWGIEVLLSGPPWGVASSHELGGVVVDFEEGLKEASALYLLRIQKERHVDYQQMTDADYLGGYGMTLKRYQQLQKRVAFPIFHPGPANIGVEIDYPLITSPHYFGDEQVRHGLIMRTAILSLMTESFL